MIAAVSAGKSAEVPVPMPSILTTNDLFDAQRAPLKLNWIAGKAGRNRLLETATAEFPGMALVGHMNFVNPNRIQVIADTELQHLQSLNDEERTKAMHALFADEQVAAIILANNNEISADFLEHADRLAVPLLSTAVASPMVIEHLQYYLTRALAPRVTLHGVYMEVLGMGVFITGESGIGKSELALELLSRNHRLIADDAVEFVCVAPEVLVGQCPEAMSEYLEVRGLGILDIRTMFGETAVRHKKKLHLVVQLERLRERGAGKIDRLRAERLTYPILGIDVPEVLLFVAPGRNLAILVEAATRAYILRVRGIDPLNEFMEKQQAIISKSSNR